MLWLAGAVNPLFLEYLGFLGSKLLQLDDCTKNIVTKVRVQDLTAFFLFIPHLKASINTTLLKYCFMENLV